MSGLNAARAAHCDGVGGAMYRFCASASTASSAHVGADQPADAASWLILLNVFEQLFTTNTSSEADNAVQAGSSKTSSP